MKNAKFDSRILILNDKYLLFGDIAEIPPGKEIELDLGCGSGDMALGIAERHPERITLAADIMLGRLRKVVRRASARDLLPRMRFLRVEARHLCSILLPDSSICRIHILCPDPWPKHRHKGHRLMSSDFMAQLHRILIPGGILHFSTDDLPYWTSTLQNIRSSGLFCEESLSVINDIADLKTEFERQWLARGKAVLHAVFRKRA